jgi:hypothetical protein
MGVGFIASLAIPSIGLVQHSLGNLYIILWLSFQIPLLFFIYYNDLDLFNKVSESKVIFIGISILICFITLNAIAYPLANKHIIPGGNERDEIILGAINELLNGRYPFYFALGKYSPVSPMPGWLLLNVPFAFLKLYWFQNIFLLIIVLDSFEVGPFANHGLCFMFFGGLSAWTYRESIFKKN